MIGYSDIQAAQRRIRGFIYQTPLEEMRFWPRGLTVSKNYYLKLESQQKTRSFKVRGAFSKLTSLSDQEKRTGVLAVSSGNHGAAVSYAANLLEIPAIIVVPEPTPQSKIKLIKHYGAEVRVTGKDYNEAHRRAHQLQEEKGLVFVDPCSDPEVIAGQGTIGLEIMDQNPGIQTILAPVGGGGLITGISVAAKSIRPDVQVIGFQTEACPAMVCALAEDKFYEEFPIEESICDALLGGVGRIPFEMAPEWLDEVLPVSEKNIKRALLHLITEEKVMAEPSAVLGLAGLLEYPGLLKGTYQPDSNHFESEKFNSKDNKSAEKMEVSGQISLTQDEPNRLRFSDLYPDWDETDVNQEKPNPDRANSAKLQQQSDQIETGKPIIMGETALVISGGNIDGSLLRKLFLEEDFN